MRSTSDSVPSGDSDESSRALFALSRHLAASVLLWLLRRKQRPVGVCVYLSVLDNGVPYLALPDEHDEADAAKVTLWLEAVQKAAELDALRQFALAQNARA